MDRYDDFFLGHNVNEPVAIEVSVRVKNIRELGDFLTNLGFEITYDGTEKGKILIDTRPDNHVDNGETYSIITPALNPQERKQFWSVFKNAIEEYIKICEERGEITYNKTGDEKNPNMFYPHLLDLNHLVADPNNVGPNEEQGDKIEEILDELEKSGEAKYFYVPNRNERLNMDSFQRRGLDRRNERYMEELFPSGYLYNGSAISDPYSVSTGYNTRFMRYGSTDSEYALSYTGITRVKEYNGYQNPCLRSNRSIGFVYQYQYQDQEQMFFENAGVELERKEKNTTESYNETVVTRFDNPCVGIYLMWGDVRDPEHYYIYKIDENDPRYQIIKNYYKPANPSLHDSKRARFETWNREGENHETYMPVRDGSFEQTQANVEAMIESERARRQAEAERIRAEEERLKTLGNDIHEIIHQINSVDVNLRVPGVAGNSIFAVLENDKIIEESEIQGKKIIATLNKIKQQLDALKTEITNNEKFKDKHLYTIEAWERELQRKFASCNESLKNLSSYKEMNKKSIKRLIEDFIEPSNNVNPKVYKEAPLEIRKDILNVFLEHVQSFNSKTKLMVLPERLIKLYTLAPKEQKAEIFDLLYQIRMKAPKDFRKAVKNAIHNFVTTEDDEKVLTELFSRDGLFVKHTEKAQKLMALRIGTANVKRKIEEMAQERQIVAENNLDLGA